MNLSDKIRIRAGDGVVTFHPYYDVLNQWADEAAKLEAEIERLDKAFDFSAVKVAEARAENEALIDALEHCGYDPNDCIDCGGPPHNEWCRFWKLRRTLSFWTPASDAILKETD